MNFQNADTNADKAYRQYGVTVTTRTLSAAVVVAVL